LSEKRQSVKIGRKAEQARKRGKPGESWADGVEARPWW
jgi:hypothetical protein